jgi:hypothetical protein
MQGETKMTPTPTTLTDRALPNLATEEVLVPDDRALLTPAQMVERKLVSMLETNPVLVSHLQDSVKRRPR